MNIVRESDWIIALQFLCVMVESEEIVLWGNSPLRRFPSNSLSLLQAKRQRSIAPMLPLVVMGFYLDAHEERYAKVALTWGSLPDDDD